MLCDLEERKKHEELALKVGSSFVNLLRALLKLAVASLVFAMIARDMTGCGTVIGSIEYLGSQAGSDTCSLYSSRRIHTADEMVTSALTDEKELFMLCKQLELQLG